MFIRKKYLFMGIFLLWVVGAGGFCLTASAGESGGKKGKAEITWLYPPKYHKGSDFSEGRAWVQEEEDGPWSLLDDQGNVLKTGLEAYRVSEYKDGIADFWLSHPFLTDNDDKSSGIGLLNRSGDVVLSPDLSEGVYGPYSEGLIARRDKDGLHGFIDLSGKWVIPPAYDEMQPFSEGLAAVRRNGGSWGFIDKTGAVVIDFKFGDAYSFSNKMARVRTGFKCGVIDPKGRWIVKPLHDGIGGDFWSELIAAEKDNKVGFINSKGDVVIDFQYRLGSSYSLPFLYCFNNGRAIVITGNSRGRNEYGIIDESGKVLFQRKNCEFFLVGDYVLCRNENWQSSLIDRENRECDLPDDFQFVNEWVGPDEKSPYLFKGMSDCEIGYFTVSVKDDLGAACNALPYPYDVCPERYREVFLMFIRKKYLFMGIFLLCLIGTGIFCLAASAGESEGKAEITWLYPPKYHDGSDFSEGRAWVQEEEDGPWSLLDDQGNVLKTGLKASSVSGYYDGIANFSPPLLTDNDDEPSRSGFLNRSGDVVLPPDAYDGIFGDYSEGLIARKGKNGLYGFIDLSGKWVIPPAYDEMQPFSEGLAAVRRNGGSWGFIDKTGAVVIDFKFGDAYSFSNKMARVRTGFKCGVIDPKGRWIVKPLHDGIGGDFWSELIAAEKDNKVGFIDSKGDVVIDFQYLPAEQEGFPPIYYFSYFSRGRAIVLLDYKDGEYWECGIIDKSGKVLLRRKNCEFFLVGDYILCKNANGRHSLIDRENREYDLPDDFYFHNSWVGADEKNPYLFMDREDCKFGYFTIPIKGD